jgi:hypothetical protein
MEKNPSKIVTWSLAAALAVLFVASLAWFLYGNYQVGDSALWQMLINGFILSIPLALFYGLSGVLIVAVLQARQGSIDRRLARWIYWSPRIASVLIILFVSLFALDMFSPEYTLGEMLLGFLIHMLLSIFMAFLLVIAWRREWLGFAAFLLAALFFLRFAIGDGAQSFGILLIFSGPMLLIALLFGANWRWRSQLRLSGG